MANPPRLSLTPCTRYVYRRREFDGVMGGRGEVGSAERRLDEGNVCDIIIDGRDLSRGNLDVPSPPPQSAHGQGSA